VASDGMLAFLVIRLQRDDSDEMVHDRQDPRTARHLLHHPPQKPNPLPALVSSFHRASLLLDGLRIFAHRHRYLLRRDEPVRALGDVRVLRVDDDRYSTAFSYRDHRAADRADGWWNIYHLVCSAVR